MIQQTLNEDSQKKYTMKIVSTDAAYIIYDISGRMALLVTLFLVLVNIFNSVTANSPKAEGKETQHKTLQPTFSPFINSRSDCCGDLGRVLHPPRVWGPRRVRTHPQDDSSENKTKQFV